MDSPLNRWCCPLAVLLLTACASGAPEYERRAPVPFAADAPERFETGPVALTVTPPALRDDSALVEAELAGRELLGIVDVQTRYGVMPGNRAQDAAVVGRQRVAQELGARLPLPFGSPLQLGVSGELEQRLTPTGVLASQQRAVKARWNDGDLRFALDARRSDAAGEQACELDAELGAPPPEELRLLSGDAKDFSLGGRLCRRALPGTLPQQARILSVATAWDDAYGRRQLRVSHASVREDAPTGFVPERGLVEFGASHAIELAGFSLSQQVALRPAQERAQQAGWAARGELRRTIHQVPVTASWQRHDSSVWSLGGVQPAGYETSLGFDFSAPLQQWLTRSSGASLSYHRLSPDDRRAGADDQLRLGVNLGW